MSKHILAMDDEALMIKLYSKIIKSLKFKHTLCQTSYEIDLLLLDYSLNNGMNGAQVLEEMLKINPDVKSILITGVDQNELKKPYQKMGFDEYMQKPIEIKKLKESILKYLKT